METIAYCQIYCDTQWSTDTNNDLTKQRKYIIDKYVIVYVHPKTIYNQIIIQNAQVNSTSYQPWYQKKMDIATDVNICFLIQKYTSM